MSVGIYSLNRTRYINCTRDTSKSTRYNFTSNITHRIAWKLFVYLRRFVHHTAKNGVTAESAVAVIAKGQLK